MNLHSSVTLGDWLDEVEAYLTSVRHEPLTGIISLTTRLHGSSRQRQAQGAVLYWVRRATVVLCQLRFLVETNELESGRQIMTVSTRSSHGWRLVYLLANAVDMIRLLR